MDAPRVFVSHAHEDNEFCHELVGALRAAGADVWYDEHDMGSGRIREIIERELMARSVFVLILSDDALNSRWVRDEADWFYDLQRAEPERRIVLVTAKPLTPSLLWLFIRGFKRIETAGRQPYPRREAIQRTLHAVDVSPVPTSQVTPPSAPTPMSSPRLMGSTVSAPDRLTVTFADGTTEIYDANWVAGGAEGEIYASSDGRRLVKLYNYIDSTTADRYARKLDTLIADLNVVRDDPYWRGMFAWPEKKVVSPRLGYRMRRFTDIMDVGHFIYAKAYARLTPEWRLSLRTHVENMFSLAQAIWTLETHGLCYPDFMNNVVVDKNGKAVLLGCNDIIVPGEMPSLIWGNTWYRAPELVTNIRATPSVLTSRHGLATLIYLFLLRRHPLIGDKVYDQINAERDDELRYGAQATYVEHPTDRSNAAKGQRIKSDALGSELQALFQRAFVDGLRDPSRRPTPKQFALALSHASDRVVSCATPDCDWKSFVLSPRLLPICPSCKQSLRGVKALPILYLFQSGTNNDPGRDLDRRAAHFVIGWPGRQLRAWHTRSDVSPLHTSHSRPTDAQPQATFEHDDANKEWRLTNVSLLTARYRHHPREDWKPWTPYAAIRVDTGTQIQFGETSEHFVGVIETMTIASH
jgi:TIR domain-containing protein